MSIKPKKPNLLERMKAAETAPIIQLEDVSNLCVALRHGGLLALPGPDMANVCASLARCEALCQQHMKAKAVPTQPVPRPAEPSKG